MASYKVNPDITEQENFVTLVNISNNTSFKPNELTFSDIALIPGADITSTLQRNSTVHIVSTADSVYAVDNVVKYRRINLPTQMALLGFTNYELKLKESDLTVENVFRELDTLVRLHRASLDIVFTQVAEGREVSITPKVGNSIYLGKLVYIVKTDKIDIPVITDLGELTNIQLRMVSGLGEFTNEQQG